ncbi:Bromodomain [Salix suchowensis]|nr:Bromodomain [Salix suchowensis]
MGTEILIKKWGTWEELLLGGAVIRHGTRDWNLVASELRARTVNCPYTFTPEICKAKYEDLQQRYSGCKAWFEELRKKRMAELRRALEQSEGSIGSLESKLEILKTGRREDCHVSYDSSQTESPVLFLKCGGIESSSKETSKDGLSAGSFTQDTKTNWTPECRVPTAVPAAEIEIKPEVSVSPEENKVPSIWKLSESIFAGQVSSLKGRRGKRKRKDCTKDVKEGSVGESEFLESADALFATRCKDNSASTSGQIARCSTIDYQSRGSSKDVVVDIRVIFDSIAENKCASVFHRRLDSQKRGRYKKMIWQHMDIDTIRSRIGSGSITTAKELFRDLLLLANNALVFYSKTTREYKSALLLRNIVTKSLRQNLRNYITKTTIALLSTTSLILRAPVKPQSARPGNGKLPGKVTKAGKLVAKTPNTGNRPNNVHSPPSAESLALKKKGASHSPPLAESLAMRKKSSHPFPLAESLATRKKSSHSLPSAESLATRKKGSGRPRKTGQESSQRLESVPKGRKTSRVK